MGKHVKSHGNDIHRIDLSNKSHNDHDPSIIYSIIKTNFVSFYLKGK